MQRPSPTEYYLANERVHAKTGAIKQGSSEARNFHIEKQQRKIESASASHGSVLTRSAGRKYFSTDACNIRGAKAIRSKHHPATRQAERPRVAECARAYTERGRDLPKDLCCLPSPSARRERRENVRWLLCAREKSFTRASISYVSDALACHSDFNDSFATLGPVICPCITLGTDCAQEWGYR